jgi:hypothetical protein
MVNCTECEYENDNDAKFCEICGSRLDWPSEAAPAELMPPVGHPITPGSRASGPPGEVQTLSGSANQVFISYRRQDTSHLAGRLYDRLADRLGENQVFMDVDSIEPGIEFKEAIEQAVGSSGVLLALIGHAWVTATDEDGHRRLDDPDDIVRLEIETALERGIRVIPVLAEGATMPHRQDLPDSLVKLAGRNAVRLSHESFRHEVVRLVETVAKVLGRPDEST